MGPPRAWPRACKAGEGGSPPDRFVLGGLGVRAEVAVAWQCGRCSASRPCSVGVATNSVRTDGSRLLGAQCHQLAAARGLDIPHSLSCTPDASRAAFRPSARRARPSSLRHSIARSADVRFEHAVCRPNWWTRVLSPLADPFSLARRAVGYFHVQRRRLERTRSEQRANSARRSPSPVIAVNTPAFLLATNPWLYPLTS